MTPAVAIVKKHHIKFCLHQYEHNASETHFGAEAVAKLDPKLGLTADQVFKTLIVQLNGQNKQLAVVVLPVLKQLDLKAIARILKCKKIELADPKLAERSSGYVVGGMSPLGQKRQWPTLIDSSALNQSTIIVSGGRRGLEIELNPQDLAALLQAKFEAVTI
ncbi:Cys-tRNA(Pro) deacylase [Candidatus Schmidhempelia bombi]|uniref:Cys-tRNA(Pro)/Cys-tRNA(Cys) deacylase n=1 Tax=Candidatus Schmidhempelia bombi str. Bimp TaxID=1387197 RepID=A0AB94IAX0_9GAMM|nr:Cys-tRNA(Pro) deacylase [Candidatus Schmidhempelia bombi]TEA26551.1 Cys-tRNA(Pro) deacylase [Candidatus Schmidhempelia bombi str. Bimp]